MPRWLRLGIIGILGVALALSTAVAILELVLFCVRPDPLIFLPVWMMIAAAFFGADYAWYRWLARPAFLAWSETEASLDFAEGPRRVGFWLMLGLIVIPAISAWFTLRRGYGRSLRIGAFSWAAVTLAFGLVRTLSP